MQLLKYQWVNFIFLGLFVLCSMTSVTAQQQEVNLIGEGVTPVVGYNPDDTPLAARPDVAGRPFGDFFGTGRTSFAVTNRFNPGPVNWKIQSNGSRESRYFVWGRDDFNYTDIVNPGYFDGDNKADAAVWRRNLQDGSGTYYINPSTALNTAQAFQWGISTDFASKCSADYDGDGRDDLTVVRREGNAWIWYFVRSSDGAYRAIQFGAAGSGAGTDTPQSGADYNGDGRDDITVIRRNADGSSTYFVGDSVSGQLILVQQWGAASGDVYITGDFLGDNRADFAAWRGNLDSGNGVWYIKENGGNGSLAIPFGIPGINNSDRAIRGDYNGDGKDDIAIYRRYRNAQTPDNNTFYWLNSPNFDTVGAYKFGDIGDSPVAAQ